MCDDMRTRLAALAENHTFGIVSGRDLLSLWNLVRLDAVLYAGSDGFEIAWASASRSGITRPAPLRRTTPSTALMTRGASSSG